MKNHLQPIAGAAALLLLAGCASFSADGGFGKVADLTRERTGQATTWQRTSTEADSAQARVAELLKQPLSADTAVELALLNNRGLQAHFFELGIAESDLVQAGRLANPSFAFSRVAGGGVTEIDRSIVFGVLSLFTMPTAKRIEQGRFEQAQYQAASEAVSLAGETRRAFFAAVAAQDLVRYGEQVQVAADASGELARRMLQAGNFNKLAQMRQQAFQADATAQLARARHQATAERERLVRLLGLSGRRSGSLKPSCSPDRPSRRTSRSRSAVAWWRARASCAVASAWKACCRICASLLKLPACSMRRASSPDASAATCTCSP